MKKNNNFYDVLKHIALILPLVITFTTTICQVYNCPFTVQIVATLAAVNTLIAGIVEVMASSYYKTKLLSETKTEDSPNIDDGK